MPSLKPYDRDLPYSYAPGLFPALECLRRAPELARRVLVSEKLKPGEGEERLRELAKGAGVRVEVADRALARLSGKENCFAAAVFEKRETPLSEGCPHVVLHRPMDEGNLGTILRTLLGFGIVDIGVVRPAADVFDPRVVRASMGALFSLRVTCFDAFDAYREGYPAHALYPFMLDGAVPLEDAAAAREARYTLVFGNEGSGLPPEFAQMGRAVRIPHSRDIDSLNLSVAAAIGAYAFTRRDSHV